MTIVLKKPILVAGVSLSFLLWLGESLTHHWGEFGNLTALIVLGSGGVSFVLGKFKRKQKTTDSKPQVNLDYLKTKVQQIDVLIDTLVEEAKSSSKLQYSQANYHLFKDNLGSISNIIKRKNLSIGILNKRYHNLNISQLLTKKFPELEVAQIDQFLDNVAGNSQLPPKISLEYDLILLIIQGDLTDSERLQIQAIKESQQKVIVVFDDREFSLVEEKKLIWQNIKNNLQGIVPESEVIEISTIEQKTKVIKYQDNFKYQESEEITPVQYQELIDILETQITVSTENLILLTAYRNALHLEQKIRDILNQVRRIKALALVEKYQLLAATATFANPFASLDLLATAAINSQMIVDLSKVYQRPLSFSQGQEISIALGKLMLKLGIVELSSQAITNLLKSNAITFVAGGVIQGVSAAYLTRICALSLVEYYQTQEDSSSSFNFAVIKEKIQLIFQQNKDNNIFTQFVQNTAFALKNS